MILGFNIRRHPGRHSHRPRVVPDGIILRANSGDSWRNKGFREERATFLMGRKRHRLGSRRQREGRQGHHVLRRNIDDRMNVDNRNTFLLKKEKTKRKKHVGVKESGLSCRVVYFGRLLSAEDGEVEREQQGDPS